MNNHDETGYPRRRFLGAAAGTIAAASFGLLGCGTSSKSTLPPRVSPMSFGPIKQIKAGVVEVGYLDAGPANGPVVILLHGWPYDIHS
jgi:hypothetical protein